ncbi:DeoR/GlpR family DNA-binding transcription regulator [uncultured Tessaracoccus sp.]|uniref:DeoR/GlpR family DNA-binding transcription regulator n=1 Tax=uncultured Tessaracoccus sp. TaxID=905023 RepID=UPI0026253FC7|nr:DeoR/GlpR family DNA-binding transcription regulator [uncultured Tessaracoccus sp.]
MPTAVDMLWTDIAAIALKVGETMGTLHDRQRLVLDYVVSHGEATIEELASKFDISTMTVYRDTAELEESGLLIRRKGVVRAASSSLTESAAAIRIAKNRSTKDAICLLASEYIRPGMSVCFDDSTTNIQLLPHLQGKEPCTVITNAEFVASTVRKTHSLSLILTGGTFISWAEAYTGILAERALEDLRPDICFMSATAIDNSFCYHPEQSFASIKRQMMDVSTKNILLVDSSKYARTALYRVCAVSDFDVIIVDDAMPTAFTDHVLESGAEVRIAKVR